MLIAKTTAGPPNFNTRAQAGARGFPMHTFASSLEPLESRIAPAAVTAGAQLSTNPKPSAVAGSANVLISADDLFYGPEVAHNGIVDYEITYRNMGAGDAANAVLHFTLPANTNLSEIDNPGWSDTDSDNVYDFTVGTVPGGASNTVSFKLRVDGFLSTSVATINAHVAINYDISLSPSLTTNLIGGVPAAVGGSVSHGTDITTPVYRGIYAVSSGVAQPGHFATTEVRVFDAGTGAPFAASWLDENGSFKAYADVNGKPVRDSVRVAVGDFNGDGFDDIVTATAHGKGPIQVFDGVTGEVIKSVTPFNGNKGLFVAAGDVDGDRVDDLVLGSALGGGAVVVLSGADLHQIGDTLHPFDTAHKHYTGGIRVAAADLDPLGEGRSYAEVFAAQGNFGNQVNVYSYNQISPALAFAPLSTRVIAPTETLDLRDSFTVGGKHYRGGLNIAAGDLNGDFQAEVIVGRNRLSSPTVDIYGLSESTTSDFFAARDSSHLVLKQSFLAFKANYLQGVRVAVADVTGDGNVDIIASSGFAGNSKVRVFVQQKNGTFTFDPKREFTAFATPLPALWVAASDPVPFASKDIAVGLPV